MNHKNNYCNHDQVYRRTDVSTDCSVVNKTIVQKINLSCIKPKRAGIIIYTYYKGSIYFGLGLDSRTHDLTDFGGHINYFSDKNVVNGLIREFEEETLNIFEHITFENIKQCPVIYDKNNLITFVHIDIDPNIVSNAFNKKYNTITETNLQVDNVEVCGITWLSYEDFQNGILVKGIFYSRVRKFLVAAGDFSYLL